MNSQAKPITVAHLTNVIDGRSNSGTARVAVELISQLSLKRNIQQVFIHFEKGSSGIYLLPNSREIVIPLRNFPFAAHFFSFLVFWIPRYLSPRQESFDVVHWHASRVFPLFFLIKSKKVCITLHDANNRIIKGVNTLWTRIFYWNLRLSISKIDHIFGVSEDACSKLVEIAHFPAHKVKRLYMASNFEQKVGKVPENFNLDPGYLICVSRWQAFKNVETLVKAYGSLAELSINLPKLLLVGKPVSGYDLPSKTIRELCLQDQVVVLQDLTDNELVHLYKGALVNIFPSLHEGFGLSVLEGLKLGCPSIDHKYTSTSEISGNAGIHVDMNSVDELSAAIRMLLSSPDLLWQLRRNAFERAKMFTWKETIETLLKYYAA
jgi:glycosyltransferase involved in cell wall biosynthesis